MKLIVAEKASVARNIAAALGAKRTDNCWTSSDFIITNCVGHLCSLAMPQDYDPVLEKWSLETLPILPEAYRFEVTSAGKKQFSVVKKLMADKRVTSIINACDGDREGENIFRLVYQLAGCRKPVERLWISSMEEPAILAGMKVLRPMSDYDHLAEAAKCREIADWIMGINFSRLYSLIYDAQLTVGRVQTPTVNMVVEREQEIQSFVPADYYIITADFGTFTANIRCDSYEKVQEVMERCKAAEGVVGRVVSEEKSLRPPTLYNLNALEQDCNRLFGATPAQTDAALQQLYENRMATYPRTDSVFLTEKDRGMTENVLQSFLSSGIVPDSITPELKLDAIINDTKVGGHPALMPTAGAMERLDEVSSLERQILFLLMFRLLEAVSPPRVTTNTKAEILIAGYNFTANGVVEKCRGWKSVEDEKLRMIGVQKKTASQNLLPDLSQRQILPVPKLKCEKKQTKPPERYTEADLLHSMEHCGRKLEDEDQREAIKDCGIGTPATRAQIIENVVWTAKNPRGLLTRGTKVGGVWKDKKHLYPTDAAMTFMKLLPEQLKSPSLTGSWEHLLSQIADGLYDPMLFQESIENYVRQMVETSMKYHRPEDTTIFEKESVMPKTIICSCPICKKGNIVSSRHRGQGTSKIVYHCTDRDCSMRMGSPISGRNITEDEVRQICRDGSTGWMDGFTSREGKPFSAKLHIVVDENGRANVKFMQAADMAICDCPVCSSGKIIPFHWLKEDQSMVEGWRCTDKECNLKRFYTPRSDRDFVDSEIVELFTAGQLSVPSGMQDRKGVPMTGTLFMEKDDAGKLTGKVVFMKRKENAA